MTKKGKCQCNNDAYSWDSTDDSSRGDFAGERTTGSDLSERLFRKTMGEDPTEFSWPRKALGGDSVYVEIVGDETLQ